MTTPTGLDRLENEVRGDVDTLENLFVSLTRRRGRTPWWKPWTRYRLSRRIDELHWASEIYRGVLWLIERIRFDSETEEAPR